MLSLPNYAYVADPYNGLVIVDVGSKSTPSLAGSYDPAGWVSGVTVSGDYAYVAAGSNGLVIVDITDKSAPALAGSYDKGHPKGVDVSGDYAYVADGSNGLVIVDVSNKSEPSLAGSYDTAGEASSVAVSGDYAYVADKNNGLMILRTDASSTDTTPPTLAITSPADGTTVTTPSITVTGTASNASGIASVTVNGVLASGALDWSTWSAEVTLAEGENTITVVATDNAGLTTTKTRTVTHTPITSPPSAVLATTLSGSYTTEESIIIGASVENTGTTPADATIEVTATSGFSDTKTVTIPAASTHSESFGIGSLGSGSYTATVNLYVDSTLLDSSSMPFTVCDPAAVKIAGDNAESLKRTAINEFDEMAGIPASASSNMIVEFGLDKLQKYVGDHLGTATDKVQNEDSSSTISDYDVQIITDDADETLILIESGTASSASSTIQKINTETGADLCEDINIWDQSRFGAQKIYPKNPVTLTGIRDAQ